jgi:hypothetical protein
VLLCLWYSSWVAFGAYAALMALVFTVVPTPSFAGAVARSRLLEPPSCLARRRADCWREVRSTSRT